MHRNDGGIVDAELLRPRWWIAQHNIVAGKHLPMNIEELQVHGSAIVTSIENCPEIAGGEGRVVTATFKTREVNTIVRAEIIGPDGTIELIEGTPIHPIWSVDRSDWVPLGELTEGETLQASGGIATVLSLALVTCSLSVYNIEVHGEHLYQAGELGLLVHNTYPTAPTRTGHYTDFADEAAEIMDNAARSRGLNPNLDVLNMAIPRKKILEKLDGFRKGIDYHLDKHIPELIGKADKGLVEYWRKEMTSRTREMEEWARRLNNNQDIMAEIQQYRRRLAEILDKSLSELGD
jgi:hypothetical protein